MEPSAELAEQMLLLPLKIVVEMLGQWAGDWLSLTLFSFWLRNGALRICIHEQGVELVNLKAEQLGRAELLEPLPDLGAGGDENGGVFCSLVLRLIFLGSSSSSCC